VRSSLANWTVLLQVLGQVSERLGERNLAPTGPAATAALIRKLTQKIETTTADDLLLSLDEVRAATKRAQDEVALRDPDHLYIPGRVVILYEGRGALRTKECQEDDEDWIDIEPVDHHCIVTDGSAAVLRFFEMDAFHIVTDHTTASYYESLANLGSSLVDVPSAENEPTATEII